MAGPETADVVVVAEDHDVDEQIDMELQLIDAVGPEYVILEDSPSDIDVDDLMENTYRTRTFMDMESDFNRKYGVSAIVSAQDVLEDGRKRLENRSYGVNGIEPESVDEFLALPFYELHPAFFESVVDSIEERESTISGHGEVSESLNSLLEFYSEIENPIKQGIKSTPRQFEEFYVLENKAGVRIVSEENEYADKGVIRRSVAIWSDRSLEEIEKHNWDVNRGREREMSSTIASYANESDEPVLAIVGKDHAREPTELYGALDDQDMSYQTVWLDEDQPFSKSVDEYLDEIAVENFLPGDPGNQPESSVWKV